MCTVTGLPHHPRAIATAAAAVADEPEADVSPAPLSQTRTRSSFGPTGSASCTLVRAGNLSCRSTAGPNRRRSSRVAPSRRITACGLPSATGLISTVSSPEVESLGLRNGDDPDIDLDIVCPDHPRVDAATVGLDHHLGGARLPGKPPSGDPHPVPRHLCNRAIGVPDHDRRRRVRAMRHLDEPIRSDSRCDVAQASHPRAVQRSVSGALREEIRVPEGVPLREVHVYPAASKL